MFQRCSLQMWRFSSQVEVFVVVSSSLVWPLVWSVVQPLVELLLRGQELGVPRYNTRDTPPLPCSLGHMLSTVATTLHESTKTVRNGCKTRVKAFLKHYFHSLTVFCSLTVSMEATEKPLIKTLCHKRKLGAWFCLE